MELCGACHGNGSRKIFGGMKTCEACDGTGTADKAHIERLNKAIGANRVAFRELERKYSDVIGENAELRAENERLRALCGEAAAKVVRIRHSEEEFMKMDNVELAERLRAAERGEE